MATACTSVCLAGNGSVVFGNNLNCYVSLMNIDLKCNSDVYMLDVNDMGTGNTFSRFVPYTLELNSQLTRSTYLQLESQFGPFTEEVLNKIFSYPSTTSCLNN